ncbi:MAG: allophycocyanin subunit beta, partial [Cyanobacteriota bacterium]
MRDAISGVIGRYDQLGRYLDRDAIARIESFYSQLTVRLAAVELINREASTIVR